MSLGEQCSFTGLPGELEMKECFERCDWNLSNKRISMENEASSQALLPLFELRL